MTEQSARLTLEQGLPLFLSDADIALVHQAVVAVSETGFGSIELTFEFGKLRKIVKTISTKVPQAAN